MRSLRLPAALALATVLAGCGLSDPYTSQPPAPPNTSTPTSASSARSTTAAVTDADPGPERGGTIPVSAEASQNRLPADAGRSTPQAALERYANLYVNWTATTVGRVEHELAAISLGAARGQALQAAATYAHDSTLQRSQVANSGTVIAIAPGQGPDAGSWLIVTRERTTGTGDYAGLPPTDHVTDAQLKQTRSGWVISSWSPQP